MRRLEVAPEAQRDVNDLLRWSEARFGIAAARRYGLLVDCALDDLRSDPERNGVSTRPDIPPDLRLYPLRWSRDRAPARVARPRHIVVFRHDPARVQIVRVLHDAMDPGRHVVGVRSGRVPNR